MRGLMPPLSLARREQWKVFEKLGREPPALGSTSPASGLSALPPAELRGGCRIWTLAVLSTRDRLS